MIYEYVINIDELRKQIEALSKRSLEISRSPRNFELKFHMEIYDKDIEDIISVLKMLKGVESIKPISI